MRHRKRGRKLGNSPAHRRALGKNMIQHLFEHERIITTVPKAKEYQRLAEKLITLGKNKTLPNIRRAVKLMGNRKLEFYDDQGNPDKAKIDTVLQKLFDDIGPRNVNRDGGYTRILRLAKRRVGDGAERAIFELVENNLNAGGDDAAQQVEAVETETEAEMAGA